MTAVSHIRVAVGYLSHSIRHTQVPVPATTDLTVEFQNTKDGSAMKTIKGTGCYCIHCQEYWADGEEHFEEVTLSCQKLENGPVGYENPWK